MDRSVDPDGYLRPGLWAHTEGLGPLNTVSDHIVVILGTAMMPHLFLRVGASRSGSSARRSMSVAAGLIGAFFLLLITTGVAAAAVVGSGVIGAVDANGQSSPTLLASEVLRYGSAPRVVLMTSVACVAFLAVLTAVSSVTFSAAVSFAHDVCVVGVTLSVAVHRYAVEFLVTFSMSVAASCVFPPLVYSFFWPGFTRSGLLWSVCGGLLLCTVLTVFSPTFSGSPYALLPDASFDWYPFHTPGLISVPAAILLGWLGSRAGRLNKAGGGHTVDGKRGHAHQGIHTGEIR